jgi:hypothetical protein
LRPHVDDLVGEGHLSHPQLLLSEDDLTEPLGRKEPNGCETNPPVGTQHRFRLRVHVGNPAIHHAPNCRGQVLLRALDRVSPRDPDVAQTAAGRDLGRLVSVVRVRGLLQAAPGLVDGPGVDCSGRNPRNDAPAIGMARSLVEDQQIFEAIDLEAVHQEMRSEIDGGAGWLLGRGDQSGWQID